MPANASQAASAGAGPPLPQELVVCIFIHGFKGTDGTFCEFPDRLKHILAETLVDTKVECVVFPAYETRGELAEATARFVDWLTTITVNLEVQHGGGAGSAKIILCGHSMGGLVAADALLGISNGRPQPNQDDKDGRGPLWPRIVACIAFDTPYLGLHPNVFKHSVSQATTYLDAARGIASGLGMLGFGAKAAETVKSPSPAPVGPDKRVGAPEPRPPSPWARLASVSPTVYAAAAGTLLAGAAAGTAYYKRQEVFGSWQWATDHLRYVGSLWDEAGMRKRLREVLAEGVVFRNFYTFLPASPPLYPVDRTFSILPADKSQFAQYFLPATNKIARDEVEAHVGMFEAKSNDGYYKMGLEVVSAIMEAVKRDEENAVEDRAGAEVAGTEGKKGAEDMIDLTESAPTSQPEPAMVPLPASAVPSSSLSSLFPPQSAVPSSSESSANAWSSSPGTPGAGPQPAAGGSAAPLSPQAAEQENPWAGRLRGRGT